MNRYRAHMSSLVMLAAAAATTPLLVAPLAAQAATANNNACGSGFHLAHAGGRETLVNVNDLSTPNGQYSISVRYVRPGDTILCVIGTTGQLGAKIHSAYEWVCLRPDSYTDSCASNKSAVYAQYKGPVRNHKYAMVKIESHRTHGTASGFVQTTHTTSDQYFGGSTISF